MQQGTAPRAESRPGAAAKRLNHRKQSGHRVRVRLEGKVQVSGGRTVMEQCCSRKQVRTDCMPPKVHPAAIQRLHRLGPEVRLCDPGRSHHPGTSRTPSTEPVRYRALPSFLSLLWRRPFSLSEAARPLGLPGLSPGLLSHSTRAQVQPHHSVCP